MFPQHFALKLLNFYHDIEKKVVSVPKIFLETAANIKHEVDRKWQTWSFSLWSFGAPCGQSMHSLSSHWSSGWDYLWWSVSMWGCYLILDSKERGFWTFWKTDQLIVTNFFRGKNRVVSQTAPLYVYHLKTIPTLQHYAPTLCHVLPSRLDHVQISQHHEPLTDSSNKKSFSCITTCVCQQKKLSIHRDVVSFC